MAKGYIGDQRIRSMEEGLRQMCAKKGYDLDTAFKGLLDYLIWLLDIDGEKPEAWRFDAEDAKTFWMVSREYFETMNRELADGKWYDAFGDLYMALHPGGGGKAQFFTPPSLCTMTAQCCISDWDVTREQQTPFGRRITISDPASGSSRLLLAGAWALRQVQHDQLGYNAIQQETHRPYLVAEDLDFNCVKMSAINMAVHGCFGECVCHDSLQHPGEVRLGYIINETMWPFPCDVPSIRRYTDPMRFLCIRHWKAQEQANTTKVLDNTTKVSDTTKMLDNTTQVSDSGTGETANNATAVLPLGSPAAPSEPRPKEPPRQLSLW